MERRRGKERKREAKEAKRTIDWTGLKNGGAQLTVEGSTSACYAYRLSAFRRPFPDACAIPKERSEKQSTLRSPQPIEQKAKLVLLASLQHGDLTTRKAKGSLLYQGEAERDNKTGQLFNDEHG